MWKKYILGSSQSKLGIYISKEKLSRKRVRKLKSDLESEWWEPDQKFWLPDYFFSHQKYSQMGENRRHDRIVRKVIRDPFQFKIEVNPVYIPLREVGLVNRLDEDVAAPDITLIDGDVTYIEVKTHETYEKADKKVRHSFWNIGRFNERNLPLIFDYNLYLVHVPVGKIERAQVHEYTYSHSEEKVKERRKVI